MQDTYLATIIQYLIKILEKQGGEQSGNSDVLTKLDNIITAVSNIKISAEGINLNTDEVEDKLNSTNTNLSSIKQLVEAGNDYNQTYLRYINSNVSKTATSTIGLADKLNSIINAINALGTKLDTINTTLAKLDTLHSDITASNANLNSIKGNVSTINSNLDTVKSDTAIVKTNTATTATNTDATNTSVKNLTNKYGYLNPTRYKSVPAGDTTFANACVLCNITDENITVTVTSSYDSSTQSVVLVPGWNPIVVKAITGATENTLLYGW